MERNRRAGGASVSGFSRSARTQRGRNPADDKGRKAAIRELNLRKRPKKGMYGLLAPAFWEMAQNNQPFGSWEKVKAEQNDEPSAPLHLQKHAKSKARSKEDKFIVDFSAVPRKQRSSITLSSRLASSAKDQQDIFHIRQRSPVTMMNQGSLNRKKRLKRSGTELNTMRKPQVSDVSVLADQEAEVAEALFVLARSIPLSAGIRHPKLDTKLDTQAMVSATLQCLEDVPPSSEPDFASAGPAGKQLHYDNLKKDEKSPTVGVVYSASSPSELVHSSVGDTELDFALPRRHSLVEEATSFRSEMVNFKTHCVPCWPHESMETTPRVLEDQCKEVQQERRINAEMEEVRPEEAIRVSTSMWINNVVRSRNCDESIRSDGVFHNSEAKIDLIALEDENMGEQSSHLLVKENSGKGLNAGSGYLKLEGRADAETQGLNQEVENQNEKTTSKTVRRMRDRVAKQEDHSSKSSPNRKVKDTGNSSVSSCFSSLSSTAVSRHAPMGLTGSMNGVPHLGCSHDGSAAISWAGSSSLSVDMKAALPATQLPFAAIALPLPKMKSCATHVYLAHCIHRAQHATRHPFWSAAFCGVTAYNFNIPPVKLVEHERLKEAFSGPAQNGKTHQAESYSMCRMASSGIAHGSSAAGSISAANLPTFSLASSETSTVTASGNHVADHAQYLQRMMWPSCVTSFPHLVNGQAGLATRFFSGPFSHPHQIPHLQPLTQQAAMVPPVQKQHQAKGASSAAMEQQKSLQSSFQLQQHLQNLKESSVSQSIAYLETQSKDLSLKAPSGVHVGKVQEFSASLSSGQQQCLSSQDTLSCPGREVKGLNLSAPSIPAMIVGPGPLGLGSAASMATIDGCGVQSKSYSRDQNQRTSSLDATAAYENAFITNVQGNSEDKRVTSKQGGVSFGPPEAFGEPSVRHLCGPSASSNDLSVSDGPILCSVNISRTQSCESASNLVCDRGPFFLYSKQESSLLKAKPQNGSTFGIPFTPPRVYPSAPTASRNALEAVTVWSSPPTVSTGVPTSALESLSGGALPLHPSRDEAQHDQLISAAQQCSDPAAQTLCTQPEQLLGVSALSLAANNGLH